MPPTYPDPLKVYFPRGGTYVAMHWWTYNERGHLALVRKPEQLDPIIQKVTKKYHDVEIKDVFDLEIVSPPQWLIEQTRKDMYESDITNFLHTVQYEVNRAVEHGGQMPPQFTTCDHTTYNCGDWEEEDRPTHDTDPQHRHCIKCVDCVVLTDMTPEQFFLRYYDLWYQIIEPEDQDRPASIGRVTQQISRARKAPEDAELWMAYENFGHHSGGLCLAKIEKHVHCPYRVLFYFLRKDTRTDVQAKMNQVVAAAAKAAQDAENARKEKHHRQQEERKKIQTEQDKKVLGFFKEH